jgi:DNA repair exonuclease SbcCD ATPase subunit
MSGRFLGVACRILPVLLLPLLGLGSAGGCASCTGDPRTDNYFCAQKNMSAYQNKLDQTQQSAENLTDENVRLKRENQDLAAQQQDLNQQIDKVSVELRTLDTDLGKLNERIQKARSNSSVNQQKLTQASRELQRVQDETKLAQTDTSGPLAERQAELDRLKKRYQDLEADIDTIMQAH